MVTILHITSLKYANGDTLELPHSCVEAANTLKSAPDRADRIAHDLAQAAGAQKYSSDFFVFDDNAQPNSGALDRWTGGNY